MSLFDKLIKFRNRYGTDEVHECDKIPNLVSRNPRGMLQVNSLKLVGYLSAKNQPVEVQPNQSIGVTFRLVPETASHVIFVGTRKSSQTYNEREVSSYTRRGRARYSNVKKTDSFTNTILYSVKLTREIKSKFQSQIGVEFHNNSTISSGKNKQTKKQQTITKEGLVKQTSTFTELYLKSKGLQVKRVNQNTIKLKNHQEEYFLASNVENTSDDVRYFGLGMKLFDYLLSDAILDGFVENGILSVDKSVISNYKKKFANLVKVKGSTAKIFIVEYLIRAKTLTTTSDQYVSYYYTEKSGTKELQNANNSISNFFDSSSIDPEIDHPGLSAEIIDEIEEEIKIELKAKYERESIDPKLKAEMEEELYQLDDWYRDITSSLKSNKRMDPGKIEVQIQDLTEDHEHYKNEINRRYISSFNIIPNVIFFGSTTSLNLESKYNLNTVPLLPNSRLQLKCTNCLNTDNLIFDDKSLNLLCTDCARQCSVNLELFQIREKDNCSKCGDTYCYDHELEFCSGQHIIEKYCPKHFNPCNSCDIGFCPIHLKACIVCKNNFCQTQSYVFITENDGAISKIEVIYSGDSSKKTVFEINKYEPTQRMLLELNERSSQTINPISLSTEINSLEEIEYILSFPELSSIVPKMVKFSTTNYEFESELSPLYDIIDTVERTSNGRKTKNGFACETDSYHCINHNEYHSTKTTLKKCDLGPELFCEGSSNYCSICQDKVICNDHSDETLTTCSDCEELFCDLHPAVLCSNKHKDDYLVCINDVKLCVVCKKPFCGSHVDICSFDNTEYVCKEDRLKTQTPSGVTKSQKITCSNHSYFCKNHSIFHSYKFDRIECDFDESVNCETSNNTCNNCGKEACLEHTKLCGTCKKPHCTQEIVGGCVSHPGNPHCNWHIFTSSTLYGTTCRSTELCLSCNMLFIIQTKGHDGGVKPEIPIKSKHGLNGICSFCMLFKSDHNFQVKVKGNSILTDIENFDKYGHIETYLLENGKGKYLVIETDSEIIIRKVKFLNRFETSIFQLGEEGEILSQYLGKTGFGSQTLTRWF